MLTLISPWVVAGFFRCEYLVALHILNQKRESWTENKRRMFTVRVVSLTHATVSALLCLYSLLSDANYFHEPYEYHKYNAQFVFFFSMGYFIYDLVDMYIHGETATSKEYVVHHSLVIAAFTIILYTGKLYGFAMIGLLVEVQTVLLHTRTLLHLAGYARSRFFKVLARANMTCLFLFRHIPITYLIYFLLVKDDKAPIVLRTLLLGGLTFLEYHNCHLTMSMLKVDGFFGSEVAVLDEDEADPLAPIKPKIAPCSPVLSSSSSSSFPLSRSTKTSFEREKPIPPTSTRYRGEFSASRDPLTTRGGSLSISPTQLLSSTSTSLTGMRSPNGTSSRTSLSNSN